MKKKYDIDVFFNDLEKLNLVFPNKELSEKLGFHIGTVSNYLNRKKDPSNSFMHKFYEVFYPNDKNIQVNTSKSEVKNSSEPNYLQELLDEKDARIKNQEALIAFLQERLNVVENELRVNLNRVRKDLQDLLIKASVTDSLVLENLDSLRKVPVGTSQKKAGILEHQLMKDLSSESHTHVKMDKTDTV